MAARRRSWSRVYALILAISGCAGHAIDDSEPAPQRQIASAGASPIAIEQRAQTASPTARCGERVASGQAIAPPKPSSTCSVARRDASIICDGIQCPVARAFEFGCTGAGYGPWVVPNGPQSSVTMFVTNSESFETHLFSVDSENGVAEDVEEPTSAVNFLTSDQCGRVSVFAGESPGIQLISAEGPAKWLRQEVVPLQRPYLAMVADAQIVDDSSASAAYYQVDDHLPRLAEREDSGWGTRVLAHTQVSSMGLDIDDKGSPWVAWLRDDESGLAALDLAAPDGSIHQVSSGARAQEADFWRKPAVLAGGVSGTSVYPALVAALMDGVHLWTADPTGSLWSDRLLFSASDSANAGGAGDCAYGESLQDPCSGKTTCTRFWNETSGRLGLVRTASGRAFAAWLHSTAEVNYSLTPSVSAQRDKPSCESRISTSRGSAELVIAALAENPAVAPTITRLSFDVGGPPDGRRLSLAVRGDWLLLAASLGTTGTDAKIAYLEIDSRRLLPGDSSAAHSAE